MEKLTPEQRDEILRNLCSADPYKRPCEDCETQCFCNFLNENTEEEPCRCVYPDKCFCENPRKPQHPCPECEGEGEVDSGGFTPQGTPIDILCPKCDGSGKYKHGWIHMGETYVEERDCPNCGKVE